MRFRLSVLIAILALSGCAPQEAAPVEPAEAVPDNAHFVAVAGHSPPFARTPYEKFSRVEAVAIAQQEWLLFGQRVDDNPPHSDADSETSDRLQRFPGLWRRVGEYWWLGQDADRRESAWTGMHDENGQEIDDSRADYYAWSAAFISYVMRTAGAGARFPYAPSHYIYINIAKDMKLERTTGWAVVAESLDEYAPSPGDLICYWRGKRRVSYDKLPVRRFPAHCDIVVQRDKTQLSVIGGNVDAAVTMKHIPVTADGRLAEGGQVLDDRYHWFVVLRVLYER
ncbi:MAG TPA: DUF2272 domain-containing protein [Acetobacteraceae bacterium]|nr:DUF2272 domain-containing protein [Acetobacteraceae bacterium]